MKVPTSYMREKLDRLERTIVWLEICEEDEEMDTEDEGYVSRQRDTLLFMQQYAESLRMEASRWLAAMTQIGL